MNTQTRDHRARAAAAPVILLVEDNVVNQHVAKLSLTSLGYRVDVADDGRQALERIAAKDYAAVVMDCQMPHMDGYEATAEIRRLEGDDRHTPIIALTASHSRADDRDRCLAVGMDDYLSKPFRLAALEAVMARWAPVSTEPDARGEHSADAVRGAQSPFGEPSGDESDVAESTDDVAIDRSAVEALLETCSPSDLLAIVDIFASDTRTLLSEISEAFRRRDAEGLRRAAHTLKGSASNLGADRLAVLSERLHHAARADLDAAASSVAQLEPAFEGTLAALYEMLRSY